MKKYTIKSLITLFEEKLKSAGYCDDFVKSSISCVTKATAKFDHKALFDPTMVTNYYKETFNIDFFSTEPTYNKTYRYHLVFTKLLKVYNGEPLVKQEVKKENMIIDDLSENLFNKYIEKCKEDGNATATINNKIEKINSFLLAVGLCDITPNKIRIYISKQFETHRSIATAIKLSLIRRFLVFCYEQGAINKEILQAYPEKFKRTGESLPSVYTPEEIKKIIEYAATADISKDNNMCYAVLCLIAFTGMRAKDVADLKVKDINWKENKITYVQSKTKRIQEIPLIPEIGNPIVKHIINRKNKSEYLFTDFNGNPIKKSNYITHIISRYISMSPVEVNGRHFGAHSLRHSLATNLVRNHVDAFTVANVLGHSNINTVKVYAKLDLDNLRKCVLEAPYRA